MYSVVNIVYVSDECSFQIDESTIHQPTLIYYY